MTRVIPALPSAHVFEQLAPEQVALVLCVIETLVATRHLSRHEQASAIMSEAAVVQPWNLDHVATAARTLTEQRAAAVES